MGLSGVTGWPGGRVSRGGSDGVPLENLPAFSRVRFFARVLTTRVLTTRVLTTRVLTTRVLTTRVLTTRVLTGSRR